jgi:hypothetical protein
LLNTISSSAEDKIPKWCKDRQRIATYSFFDTLSRERECQDADMG